jgi:hypothetical protein
MATPGSATRLRAVSAPTVAILAVTGTETFQVSDVLESIVDYTSRNAAPGLARGGVLSGWGGGYFVILYVRSPAAFLDESILWPPLLPRMLTNPRTVCRCQSVAFMISSRVAPFARCIIAITSAFLLARSPFDLLASFLASVAFFAALAFLAGLRPPLGFADSGGLLLLSVSIVSVVMVFSFASNGLRLDTFIAQLADTSKSNLLPTY